MHVHGSYYLLPMDEIVVRTIYHRVSQLEQKVKGRQWNLKSLGIRCLSLIMEIFLEKLHFLILAQKTCFLFKFDWKKSFRLNLAKKMRLLFNADKKIDFSSNAFFLEFCFKGMEQPFRAFSILIELQRAWNVKQQTFPMNTKSAYRKIISIELTNSNRCTIQSLQPNLNWFCFE